MAGVYSKERPMLITSTGDALMQYNFALGGVFQDVGAVVHGNLQDQDINAQSCTNFEGYSSKMEPTSSEDIKLDSKDLKIFPNPSLGGVNIQSNEDLYSVELFTLSGELILKNKPNSVRNYTLDLSRYAQGVYFLKVYSNQTVSTHKIQKL